MSDLAEGTLVVTDPALLTATAARRRLDAGLLSAVELARAVLERTATLNPGLHAYLHVDADAALAAAREADRRHDQLPLNGIPVCVKDVLDVRGTATTAGSAKWCRVPRRDATAVARLRAAGAVILGNAHTNEFAFGVDGRNPHRGDCVNPHDHARITGGSSSGPAVATAAGMALAGVGTDTSGSLRIPASLCGLTTIRPTPGLVPTDGVVPLAPSYDTVGPMARSAEDAALLLAVLAGHRPDDRRPDPDVRGLRIGLIEELVDASDPPIASGVIAAAETLAALGARVRPFRVPLLRAAAEIHPVILHSEAFRTHRHWFDTQRDHYSDPVRRRLEAGREISPAVYAAAQRARAALAERLHREMDDLDVLLAPSTPIVASPRHLTDVSVRGIRLPIRSVLLRCTMPLSQFGVPVASVPVGVHDGLPYGMQILGRPFTETLLLGVAAAYERTHPLTGPVAAP